MVKDKNAHNIEAGIGQIKESQEALDKELLAIEAWLNELGRDADAVNARLRKAKAGKPDIKEEPKTAAPEEDFKAEMEKLLKGSLEHLEDRLSDRILNMLKDLKDVKDKDDISAIKTATENLSKEIQKIGEYMQKNPQQEPKTEEPKEEKPDEPKS